MPGSAAPTVPPPRRRFGGCFRARAAFPPASPQCLRGPPAIFRGARTSSLTLDRAREQRVVLEMDVLHQLRLEVREPVVERAPGRACMRRWREVFRERTDLRERASVMVVFLLEDANRHGDEL